METKTSLIVRAEDLPGASPARRAAQSCDRVFEPSWIYWFDEQHAHGIAGQGLLALGRPAEAEPHFRDALALIDPGFTRGRAELMGARSSP